MPRRSLRQFYCDMTKIGNKTWLVLGFGLSLISVVTNVLVVSGINERVRGVDGEITKLESSIESQTMAIDRAAKKYDLFLMMHHISKLSSGEKQQLAGQNAFVYLQGYLKAYYSAVNGISETELLRSEQGKIEAVMPIIDKINEAKRLQEEGKPEEAKRLRDDADAMFAVFEAPDELGRSTDKLTAFLNDPALAEKATLDVIGVMAPRIRELVGKYLGNHDANIAKLAELREKRLSLSQWSSRATYAAISLQLFALFFFFAKDLVKEKKAE